MLDPHAFELSLEQQFEVCRLQQQTQDMSREQALELLLKMTHLLMVKDNLIRDLTKQVAI
ncbi:MAG TPA: NblA/ycf18 family protein [Leptolyngbyaceae cyanobacterium M33_DOE_097]|uniref:Photosystem I reaction center subunit XII n=1 Tax=Oscillatoriales cyanobacterium SpSt-418 TaxID=2282169 RepID=A0A7C3PEQ1_9CYAN|nr:NblA/ycf18 family protein [Leptolyngbyaceae cyanobacterium M33_DOE_097]